MKLLTKECRLCDLAGTEEVIDESTGKGIRRNFCTWGNSRKKKYMDNRRVLDECNLPKVRPERGNS